MRKTILLFTAVLTLAISCSEPQEETMDQLIDRVFAVAAEQSKIMSSALADDQTPKTFEDGKLVKAPYDWWCSGFFPGVLWYIYEYNGDADIKELAIKETAKVEPVKYVTDHHDVGFMINCCYGHQYRLTGDEHALEVLRTAAQSLTGAFTEEVGCIKSWPFVKPGFSWVYPVIIDNMMNLELLMSVANMDNNEWLRHVAVSHADVTMKNHFREDYTTCHLVDYVPGTGEVNKKITVQGLADSSAWARGQAWALYGYTMMYQQTGDKKYLHQAQHIGDMIEGYLPEDGIPYWDFNDPKIPDTYRDASAGAVMASAYIALDQVADNGKDYLAIAEKQLRTLASEEYLAKPGEIGGFILKHSVGNLPEDVEIDVPLTYADYYFIEALMRYHNLK
jgi:hypothetical protein